MATVYTDRNQILLLPYKSTEQQQKILSYFLKFEMIICTSTQSPTMVIKYFPVVFFSSNKVLNGLRHEDFAILGQFFAVLFNSLTLRV